ncbi:hypothetical protein EV356DRAFT_500181 [Viridothelium virens]|uniref:Uncharacterized protein n=1 Tax=Viridothelium virens TaxID=1048519 RepID=A0A6A6HC03_VIRVR|nr:hypothetical protein EV356DRAFT_500181 [Viridothelium virens]
MDFDNNDDSTVLRNYWPVLENDSILIASRGVLAKTRTHVSTSHGIDQEPFNLEESGQVLRRITDFNGIGPRACLDIRKNWK